MYLIILSALNIQYNYLIVYKKHDEIIIVLRIDLIKFYKNEILIIDYKSDETLPNKVPSQYLQQLNLYKTALQKLYPHHKINCAILWIRFLQIMAIPC